MCVFWVGFPTRYPPPADLIELCRVKKHEYREKEEEEEEEEESAGSEEASEEEDAEEDEAEDDEEEEEEASDEEDEEEEVEEDGEEEEEEDDEEEEETEEKENEEEEEEDDDDEEEEDDGVDKYEAVAAIASTGKFGPSKYQGSEFATHAKPEGENKELYSRCNGRRRALCIGINYTGTDSELSGCHNDAKNVANFLQKHYHFKKKDIVMLLDTEDAPDDKQPTHANIIAAMEALVADAQPNDSLFFHYSGHGGQEDDDNEDEDDGIDETICPLDYEEEGQIIDDQMHDILVSQLPQGCRLTAVFDSCHSGSALDLPYIYSTHGKLKGPSYLSDVRGGAVSAVKSYMTGDKAGALASLTEAGKKVLTGIKATDETRATKTSKADVISWSGCKDSQTSADTEEDGKATGAMSWAFISALKKCPSQTYKQLLNTIRDELKGSYDQRPQLSCSHELDCDLVFVC